MHIGARIFFVSLVALAATSLSAPRTAAAVEGTVLLGLGKPTDANADRFNWGPSVAGSVGGRVAEHLSLHGQLQLSALDPRSSNESGQYVQIAFVPLIHLLGNRERADLVVGPNVGFYQMRGELEVLGVRGHAYESGPHAGVLFGAFFDVSRSVSMGFFLQYDLLFPQRACVGSGDAEACDDSPNDRAFFSMGFGLGF